MPLGVFFLSNYAISTPEIWKLTVVAEADPARTLVASRTCFRSKSAVVFAASETPDRISTPSNLIVNVAAVAAVFATTMFVTTAVVAEGTVYSVVFDVAAAVLARVLDIVVAIYFYFR